MDHFFRQLGNLHRLPHIQYEHIAALAHGASLNHQLSRFGDGHEVAGDIGMGNRNRPTLANLLVKTRNHRA